MAMTKGQSLQEPFLNALRRERVPVSVYLVNGIKLQGALTSTPMARITLPAFVLGGAGVGALLGVQFFGDDGLRRLHAQH